MFNKIDGKVEWVGYPQGAPLQVLVEILPFRSNIWMKSIDLPAEGIILNIRIAGSPKIDRSYRSTRSNSVVITIDRDTPDRWDLSEAAPRIWYFE